MAQAWHDTRAPVSGCVMADSEQRGEERATLGVGEQAGGSVRGKMSGGLRWMEREGLGACGTVHVVPRGKCLRLRSSRSGVKKECVTGGGWGR